MTENLIEIEARWAERQLPRAERASVTVSAWTTDEEVARRAAELESAYGNRYDLDTAIRQLRTELRRAAIDTAATSADSMVLIRSVLDGGVDELVTANTTDSELDVLVTAAEAGYGQPIPGLRRELELLRDGECDDTFESA
ncbi:hypothetical protein PJI74_01040 [Mycobacterium kansasii]